MNEIHLILASGNKLEDLFTKQIKLTLHEND